MNRPRCVEGLHADEFNPEGTANLCGIDLAPNEVATIKGRIETRARQLKRSGDPRTMDQLRADIFVDLLKGKGLGGRHGGVITLTADLKTLAELAEKAADLPGLGPVVADIANQVLGEHPTPRSATGSPHPTDQRPERLVGSPPAPCAGTSRPGT